MAHFLARVVLALFIAGWIGCAITIPMAAFKYAAVLFEKDTAEPDSEIVQASDVDDSRRAAD